MPIRAAQAKGTHTWARGMAVGFGPRLELLRHAQPQIVKTNLRVWGLKMQARRNLPVVQAQRRLEQTDNAGAGFQMSHIAFDRADHASFVRLARLAVDRTERSGLDGIADRRASAV